MGFVFRLEGETLVVQYPRGDELDYLWYRDYLAKVLKKIYGEDVIIAE